ncbi:penicillin-binding protein 1C [Aurantimonas marianensis]|uniref:peptidoglycan glycosyltransferase n=1 Tax=Aurantimonas marianensis TaxID=2920428 RepID=A0A9X2HC08_9HYPH|nr:penicillin-binding protein 1C [Aurantimonas marianensis]MCP3054874.1 penicillin-binding protein 1C [Aurantimonas marianensis]
MSRQRRLAQAGMILLLCAIVAIGWSFAAFERAVASRIAAFQAPRTGAEVVDRNGALLRAFASDDGRWRLEAGADDVDPRYLAMLLAWEDKRFVEHGGVDPRAFLRAAWETLIHRHIVSGGSTLTMQVARMLGRLPTGSLAAKGEQVLVAIALERTRSKAEILSLYLQLAPYGGNLEGVRAASLSFFGKEPKRLTAAEAALLVALPQSPERYRPDRYPARAKAARDRVLNRMETLGVLDAREAARAQREAMPAGRRALPMLAAHAAVRLHGGEPDRPRIHLTIDKAIQERLEAYARDKAKTLKKPVSLAILVSDAATGEVLAQVGSPDLFDRERQGFVDLTRALRSPGSTLKPLIYGLAFERGIAHPESLVDDSPGGFSGYTPQNFDRVFEGVITARRALQLSRNLPAVELLSAVGPARLLHRMKRAGARPELGDRSLPGLAIGLGGLGLTLEDLVRIYGAIANGGVAMPLHIEQDAGVGQGKRILSPQAAWYVTSILAGATTTNKGSPGDVAYKTGTSYGYRDAWTIGYDGRHVVGVWLGRPDGAPVAGLVGQDSAAPVMRDVFARLGPVTRLPGPPPGILASAGGGLPPPMRRIGRAAELMQAGLRPEIVFPPNAARVEIGLGRGQGADLFLKVRNGRPPFTWYVDGRPVVRDALERQSNWRASEPGFVDIAVVDAAGAAARSQVFVE